MKALNYTAKKNQPIAQILALRFSGIFVWKLRKKKQAAKQTLEPQKDNEEKQIYLLN